MWDMNLPKLTEYRSQLYQQPDAGYLAALPEVLVPDHGLGDALRLRGRCPEPVLEQVERYVSAVVLEGHERAGHVGVRGADVVEEAGEEVGFGGDGEGVRAG